MRLSARHKQDLRRNNRAEDTTSASSTTRAQDAAFELTWITSTLTVHSRHRPKYVQRPAPSHIPRRGPRPQRRGVPLCGLEPELAFPSSRRIDSHNPPKVLPMRKSHWVLNVLTAETALTSRAPFLARSKDHYALQL
jgi:hypothetical protein